MPIVAVPFMGETGRRLCAEAGVSWVDLSGNAWIDAPGKQIRFVGHKNRLSSAGRPADVFAPRSSRVMVRPVDDGVFVGAGSVDGLPCVHPLQVYLDLKAQPERAAEAAVELRKRLIQGGTA